MGLLSGTFEDGSFAVFAVPDPSDVVSPEHDQSYPVCEYLILLLSKLLKFTHSLLFLVKMPHPILRIELEETSCWSFDCANSELIAIGTTNGRSYL